MTVYLVWDIDDPEDTGRRELIDVCDSLKKACAYIDLPNWSVEIEACAVNDYLDSRVTFTEPLKELEREVQRHARDQDQ